MINFSAVRIHPTLMNFTRPSPHSIYSPSAMDRILACAFSVKASEGIESEDSFYSKEGTLAHTVCEATFRQVMFGLPFSVELQMERAAWEASLVREGKPSALAEMEHCAHGYVDLILFWLNNKEVIGDVVWYGLEKGIPIFPEKLCFGTGDCIIIGTKASVVIDYKHGQGKNVDANSLQLKAYAAGIARYIQVEDPNYSIFAVVYQPRITPTPKETSYTMGELNQFLGVIWNAIVEAERNDIDPVEGKHCWWCPASRTKDKTKKCRAILAKPMKLAEENFAAFMSDMNRPAGKIGEPNDPRDAAIIKLRTIYPWIKQVVEDSEDEFVMRIQAGEAIPGVRLTTEFGNRTLNAKDDETAAKLIAEKFPHVNPWKVIPETKKLKSLTEIEKEFKVNLSVITVKKGTNKIEVLDERSKSILTELNTLATSSVKAQ